jgi:hypothetical protein
LPDRLTQEYLGIVSLYPDNEVLVSKIDVPIAGYANLLPLDKLEFDSNNIVIIQNSLSKSLNEGFLTKGQYVELTFSNTKLHFQVMSVMPSDVDAVMINEETKFNLLRGKEFTIQEIQELRLLILDTLHKLTQGDTRIHIDAISLGVELGFDTQFVERELDYLRHERLIKIKQKYYMFQDSFFPTVINITITHNGVIKLERLHAQHIKPAKQFIAHIYNPIFTKNIDIDMHKQVFKNIRNSTIINESLVKDSLKKIADLYGNEKSKALSEIAELIEKSQNQKAGEIFTKFIIELNKPNRQKSRLKQLWKEIETILPTISSLTDSVSKISSFFN